MYSIVRQYPGFRGTELSLGFLKQEFRTPIWQKAGVPLEKVGVPLQKSWSLNNFRSTDFNPISINGLFLLNKTKYFGIFFPVT